MPSTLPMPMHRQLCGFSLRKLSHLSIDPKMHTNFGHFVVREPCKAINQTQNMIRASFSTKASPSHSRQLIDLLVIIAFALLSRSLWLCYVSIECAQF